MSKWKKPEIERDREREQLRSVKSFPIFPIVNSCCYILSRPFFSGTKHTDECGHIVADVCVIIWSHG